MKTKMKTALAAIATAMLLAACSTPQLQIDRELREYSTAYTVKGRNGWLIRQELSFGDFQTGKVRRGWTKSYNVPFVVRFSGAKERLSFPLRKADGPAAEVFCLGELKEQDLTLFHRYFDLNLDYHDAFTGSVVFDDERAYDFYVSNLNQNNYFREATGRISGAGEEWDIRAVTRLDNNQPFLGGSVPGFEFVRAGRVVGTVSTINAGTIWLHRDLPADEQLVLAGVATALLLRSDLAEAKDVVAVEQ